jgi:hypothetical protein
MPVRTLRWLIKVLTWGLLFVFCFVVHTAWYSMDAIRLGGNVWIKMPLRLGKCELWGHDRPTIGLGESSCGYSHTYMSDHVIMRVLNCGYICRVAVILKYIHRGMYIWKVFSLLLTLHALLGNCWAKLNFSAGTLTTHRCRPIVSPIWESVCMPPPSARSLKFY